MKKLEQYRKFTVSLIGNLTGVYAVIEAADLSTKEGIQAAVLGVLASLVVYVAPNGACPPK